MKKTLVAFIASWALITAALYSVLGIRGDINDIDV